METGRIIQVMGPVVDVEFPPGQIPEVLTALVATNPGIDARDDNLVVIPNAYLTNGQSFSQTFTRSFGVTYKTNLSFGLEARRRGYSPVPTDDIRPAPAAEDNPTPLTSLTEAQRLEALRVSVWHVTPEVFEKLAFGERAEGVVAVAQTPERTLEQLGVTQGGLVAVLCGLEKPGNVGAILRSADGSGVAAVKGRVIW